MFSISDERYAEELQLQEALMASAISSRIRKIQDDDDRKVKRRETQTDTATGKFSLTFCPICMDAKPPSEIFKNSTCSHQFCSDCIAKHVAVKIQDNITRVKCPDLNCPEVLHLDPEFCRQFLPEELFDRWEKALCESAIIESEKIYCPFENCSVMLVDDGEEKVTVSECPSCHRLFCAQCKVPWHSGLQCGEFHMLKRDGMEDAMMTELAKRKKWRRCPNCKFYVKRRGGCLHIACRDATLGLVIVNNTKVQSFVYLCELTIGTGYIDNYEDDNILKEEVTKRFFQLTVESLQWGEATLPNALFLGIVEFVMIKGDNGSENVKMGDGEKWDESPEVTGCFLEYCNNEMPGFVAGLNKKMKDSYYTNFTFQGLFGKSLDDAWAAYKAQYPGN